ncbi:hypothetical protein KEM55_006164, partial [Ascosphaera atra]
NKEDDARIEGEVSEFPNPEGGVSERVERTAQEEIHNGDKNAAVNTNKDDTEEDEEVHSALLPEVEVEALLRGQQQQFVADLARQQCEQQQHHEAELEALRSQHAIQANNHVQPPTQPSNVDLEGLPQQQQDTANNPTSEILKMLHSLKSEVENLKRLAPEATTATTTPPTQR